MYEPQDPRLKYVAAALSPESWEARVLAGQARARQFEEARRRQEGGMTVSAAIREVFPGEPVETRRPQYRRYLDEGVEGLINRRLVQRDRVITTEMGGASRACCRRIPSFAAGRSGRRSAAGSTSRSARAP